MNGDQFLATVKVGDVLTGTVAEFVRSTAMVVPDGFGGGAVGVISSLDRGWGSRSSLEVGDRVSAEVVAVDHSWGKVVLSLAATEHPELWAFLKGLRSGQRMGGTVAAIERFGVFVGLDDGPPHPCFAGVGFVTMPELSWVWFEDPAEIVSVGQRVVGEFLAFDTTNGEARLSLRATQPDPLRRFALAVEAGQILRGRVTKLVPFGAFVRVGDGVEGLVHNDELSATPVAAPEEVVQVGDEVDVTVVEIDVLRRRLTLSCRR